MLKPAKRAKSITGVDIGTGFLKLVDYDGAQITNACVVAMPDNMMRDGHLARTYLLSNHEDCQNFSAAKEACDAFAAEIQRIVSFYDFSYRDSSLGCIYYGGTACQVAPLVESLRSTVSVPLRNITELLPAADDVDKKVLEQCLAAAGLVLA